MSRIDETELKKQIKSKEFSNVYMIYGTENYLKQFYVNKIVASVVEPAFADFNFHKIDGQNTSMDEILRDAQMLPMMSSYNCVLVHDYSFDQYESDLKALKDFFSDVPESTVLIFWFDSVVANVDDRNSSKWKNIEKAFAKVGTSVDFKNLSDYDIAKIVVARAKKQGCTISNDLAKYFVSIVGSDLKTAYNEIDKICSFVGGGDITKDNIETLATKCLQAKIFDLSKYMVKGDNDKTFEILNSLLYNNEEPIAIISIISGCYIDMYRVKCAKMSNNNEFELPNYFSKYRGKEFIIKNASRDSRNLTVEQLRKCINILSDADTKLKSTMINKNQLLEQTVALILNEVHNA